MTITAADAKFRVWHGTSGDTVKNKMLHDKAAPRLADAIRVIAALPDADAIARLFEAQGVTGKIGISSGCPAALWFAARVGWPVRIAHTISIAWDGATTSFDCPAQLIAFYERFDRGMYPGLREPDKYGRVPEYAAA